MAVPSTNIKMSQIRTELGSSSNSLKALSELAGKSGQHSMSEFSNYALAATQSFVADGTTRYFGKGAKTARGVLVSQPSTAYFSHVNSWGSIASGGTLGSVNWGGVSLTVEVASWMRRGHLSTTGALIIELKSPYTTAPSNQTWWNSLSISKSGYVHPFEVNDSSWSAARSHTFYRSAATISWDSTDRRLRIIWPATHSNDAWYALMGISGVTWRFSK